MCSSEQNKEGEVMSTDPTQRQDVIPDLREKILFLCTGNSCRSQMAEGWLRALKGRKFEAFSAGTRPQNLNPLAVKVMSEVGVDISKQDSKHVDTLSNQNFEYIISVCGSAEASCPIFAGNVKKLHMGFDDPPKLAEHAKSEEDALVHYRRVRDEIKTFIEGMPENLHNT